MPRLDSKNNDRNSDVDVDNDKEQLRRKIVNASVGATQDFFVIWSAPVIGNIF
jgi:hypothetical protein